MRRTSFAGIHCSLARSLEVIGDWWTPLILRDLYLGVTRFDDLVLDLGISRNLLASRLRALVANGLVERRRYQEHPPRFDHVLSEAGRELVPVLLALTAWGDRWAAPRGGAPLLFAHRTCGQLFRPEVRCSACGEEVRAPDVVVRPGPGGRAGRGTRVVARRLQERAGAA
jgi:DNA-binding HxlR family transcriptional regulator